MGASGTDRTPRDRLPMAMLLAAALLWGVSIPIMKALGTEQARLFPGLGSIPSSLASLCLRFGLAGAVMAAVSRRSPLAITAREWREGGVLGLITAVSMLCQVDGLNYTRASTAGFLIALYCVLVPLISCAAGWRRWSLPLMGSCLLVVVGLGALTGVNLHAFNLGRGEWENLGAAGLFAAQILWIGRLKPGSFDPYRLTVALGVTVTGLCLLALALMPQGFSALSRIHASPRALWLTATLAIAGTALPFLAMNRFQPMVDAVPAGFIYCFEPLAAVFGALFLPELLAAEPSLYPNETLGIRIWVGGGFILAANLLLLLDSQPSPR